MSEALVVEIELNSVSRVTGGLQQVANLTRATGTASKGQAASATQAARALSAQISVQRQAVMLQMQQVKLAQMQQKQNKPAASFGSRLSSLINSSRVGFGGGGMSFMPLVGRILNLLGPVGKVVEIVAALGTAAKQAADALTSFRDAMLTSGGTTGETARLGAIGGAIGLSEGQMAAMARGFSEAISQGGVAAGFASKAGIHDIGLFGNTDKATNLLKMADALRHMSDAEALRTVRSAPALEPLLKYRDLSEKTMQELKKDAIQRSKVFTPEQARNAAEFNAETSRLIGALEMLTVRAIEPLIPILTKMAEAAANFINLIDTRMGVPKGGTDIFGNRIAGNEEKGKDAAGRLKDAADDLKDAAAAMKNGIYGGGERARGVLPGKISGFNAHAYIGSPISQGALSL